MIIKGVTCFVLLLAALSVAYAQDVRTVNMDGKDVLVILERNDKDGGIITSTLVPKGDGTYYSHRTWEGRGMRKEDQDADPAVVEAEKKATQAQALQKAQALTDEEIAERAAKATELGVSGRLLQP